MILAIIRRGCSFGGIPGVIFSNGITWVELRRSSLHILKDFGMGKNSLENIIEEEVENLIQFIEDHWVNTPLDVSNFFNIAVLASLWRIISGESLKIGDPKLDSIVSNLQAALKEVGNPLINISMNSINLYKFLHKIGLVNGMRCMGVLVKYCANVTNSYKTKIIDGDNPLTFIEALLHKIQTTDNPSHPLHGETGELNLLNVVIDFFIAGSDTTSNTLNWAMLYMILHPDIQTKVREELQNNIGLRKVKMDERHLTPYTEAVLHEISRKGNILPLAVFHEANESIDAGQYKIPSKSVIIPLIGQIMNDPVHFTNPSKFNPERYLTTQENGDTMFTPHPHVIPFGIGKRRCLGETLARTTLYKFFTAIIQRYEITSGQIEPLEDKCNASFVKSPLPFKLKFVKLS